MKKLSLILCLIFIFSFSAFAEEAPSTPKLMVTEYTVDGGTISAGNSAKLTVKLTNTHRSIDIKNIKLTFSDPSGEIIPDGTGTAYVSKIYSSRTYNWELTVKATAKASDGNHAVTVSAEYETESGGSGNSSDTLNINVKGKTEEETPKNNSSPRLMVTGYEVENGFISPDSSATLKVTIKNTNPNKAVSNIKLSLGDESGEIKPDGMGTKYVSAIAAGGEYVWTVKLTAANTAAANEHKLNLSMEYEDENHSPYSATDTLLVQVRQAASLDYSGAQLPVKVIQGNVTTVTLTFMNTGKSTLYNCMFEFNVEGLNGGGSTFIGTINAGESGTGNANLRVSEEILGKVSGTLTIIYEDDYGEKYTKTVDVQTVIEEKVEPSDIITEEEEKQNNLWRLFLLIGLAVGGGLGFGIPHAINSSKQRKEDEKRL
ncbi:MAG: hypothetical protein IJE14_09735 [Clostridia bacterium]|nr:hypothetical protein [Clostridia bacterium]